jgi:hypothetical protein
MSYLDDIAALVKDEVPVEVGIPEEADHLFVLYAVLVRVRGQATTARDVHDAWSAWMRTKDPAHESLVPFEQLPPDVQAEDEPFVEAIRAVASRIG